MKDPMTVATRRIMSYCIDCGNKLSDEEKTRCTGCTAELIQARMQPVRMRLDNNQPVYLYLSIYIPVDSEVNGKNITDRFDIGPLQQLGLVGWEVVQIVPKTLGLTLQNRYVGMTYETNAGGIGGIVAGVYVLLKRELREPLTEETEQELSHFIRMELATAA